MATKSQIAWAAGVFEGEGCFAQLKRGTTPQVQLRVTTTDLDVLERFQHIVNCGHIYVENRERADHHKQQYTWCLYRIGQIRRVVEQFRPWLGERRTAKADELLLFSADMVPRREEKVT